MRYFEWQREKQFKYAVLKSLAMTMHMMQLRGNERRTKVLPPFLMSFDEHAKPLTRKPQLSRKGSSLAEDLYGMRAMRIKDEVTVQEGAGAGMQFYLSERYHELPPGAPEGASIYDQLASELQALGATVYSKPPHPPGAWFILFLCPGAFADPVLVEEFSALLRTGVPEGSAAATAPSPTDMESSPTNMADLPSHDRSQIVALFSTALPFGDYIGSAPSDLSELGIFAIMYDKWPLSQLMQTISAKLVVSKRLTPVAEQKVGRLAALRRSLRAVVGWRVGGARGGDANNAAPEAAAPEEAVAVTAMAALEVAAAAEDADPVPGQIDTERCMESLRQDAAARMQRRGSDPRPVSVSGSLVSPVQEPTTTALAAAQMRPAAAQMRAAVAACGCGATLEAAETAEGEFLEVAVAMPMGKRINALEVAVGADLDGDGIIGQVGQVGQLGQGTTPATPAAVRLARGCMAEGVRLETAGVHLDRRINELEVAMGADLDGDGMIGPPCEEDDSTAPDERDDQMPHGDQLPVQLSSSGDLAASAAAAAATRPGVSRRRPHPHPDDKALEC